MPTQRSCEFCIILSVNVSYFPSSINQLAFVVETCVFYIVVTELLDIIQTVFGFRESFGGSIVVTLGVVVVLTWLIKMFPGSVMGAVALPFVDYLDKKMCGIL
jgi:hypothetical protein